MIPVVTLLTDFGEHDGYVGAMKGALLRHAPGVQIVDVSHAVPPGDVAHGAFVLAQSSPVFPEGSVHLAVIDPGVGSERRALALRAGAQIYVAPDNGLLTGVLGLGPIEWVHALEPARVSPGRVSPVFHGRDLFAPAAGWLASGHPPAGLGPAVAPESLVRLPAAEPRSIGPDEWEAPIVHVDRFGSLITSLPLPEETGGGLAQVAEHRIPFARTYSDCAPGELLAVRGSLGRLEIACNRESAARRLGVGRGDVVKWRALERR